MFEQLISSAAAELAPPPSLPGSPDLIAGTLTAGYYGLVPAAQFITGDSLAVALSISAGTSINSSTDWMKFSLDGKTLLVPQKNIRTSISWTNLSAATVIFGTKLVTIGGRQYKVRLFKGCPPGMNQSANENGFDTPSGVGSEWNRLMYHVAGKPFADVSNTLASEGITVGDWAQYSEAALNVSGVGSSSWCQETHASNALYQLFRGGASAGVSRHNAISRATASTVVGWRPVLELV